MHGASALYQPAMDQDSGEIIFPDTEEYGDFLSEDSWYEWQQQYMDDPDTQDFPLENKDFTVRESRHTAVDDEETFAKKPELKRSSYWYVYFDLFCRTVEFPIFLIQLIKD